MVVTVRAGVVVVVTATVKGWRAAAADISLWLVSTTSCTYCLSVTQNIVVYNTCVSVHHSGQ